MLIFWFHYICLCQHKKHFYSSYLYQKRRGVIEKFLSPYNVDVASKHDCEDRRTSFLAILVMKAQTAYQAEFLVRESLKPEDPRYAAVCNWLVDCNET